jgi:hypothetical protein
MAAAVPQHVREFHAQISKAQMAIVYLQSLLQAISALADASHHQHTWPSEAGIARLAKALHLLQAQWRGRYAATLGSLDECLAWSPVHSARKTFSWAGWSWDSLQAATAQDRELLSFCLLGQDGAHGAWQAHAERSQAASRFALAAAVAPLGMQLAPLRQPFTLSVDERLWAVVCERFMVKGNGKRFPAGQWVAPRLTPSAQALPIATWSTADAESVAALHAALPDAQAKVVQALAAVQAFQREAGNSLEDQAAQVRRMQDFAQAFAQAGALPSYDWVLAVVPAVRAVSRRRVARLLQSRGALV